MITSLNYSQWHRVRLMLLALACAASVMLSSTSAHAQGQTVTAVAISSVNVRSAPSLTASVVGTIKGTFTGALIKNDAGESWIEHKTGFTASWVVQVIQSDNSANMPLPNTSSNWLVTWLPGADLDRGDGTTFRQDAMKFVWRQLAPQLWPVFPNVPNSLVPEFPVKIIDNEPTVPDGLEFGMHEANFCQQLANEACRIVVASRSYWLYTGDYDLPGVNSCIGSKERGCQLILVNVGDESVGMEGVFHQGYMQNGRYWNGEPKPLSMALWGAASHVVANMTNQKTTRLNEPDRTNAGDNCSAVFGCQKVDTLIHFMSGGEGLMQVSTIYVEPR